VIFTLWQLMTQPVRLTGTDCSSGPTGCKKGCRWYSTTWLTSRQGCPSSRLRRRRRLQPGEQLKRHKNSQEAVAVARQQAEAEAAAAASVVQPTSHQAPIPTQTLQQQLSSPATAAESEFSFFTYNYHDIKKFKAKYIADVEVGINKKLKSELQQAVNTSLNAISVVSWDHLRNKLTQLLSGQTVEVKEMQVNAASHLSGVKFCMAMIPKCIIKQGEM